MPTKIVHRRAAAESIVSDADLRAGVHLNDSREVDSTVRAPMNWQVPTSANYFHFHGILSNELNDPT